MQIKLSEVVDALEKTGVDDRYYYYIPEQRIISFDYDGSEESYEDFDEKELIALPSHKEKDDYGIMARFIEDLEDIEAKGWLEEAIKGAGAFRRFRSTLERFGMQERWLDYLYDAYQDLAIEWCNYYGIEYLDDDPYARVEEKEETRPVIKDRHDYRLIRINEDNIYGLVYLVKDFRKHLAKLKNRESDVDVDEALEELKYYVDNGYPIYAISDAGRYIGYEVMKIIEDVVWVESIYVLPEYRRKGVGKLLLQKAEEISEEYRNDTLYFNVHPNNHGMLRFLKTNGYDVLNLIEIRKAWPGEEVADTYDIDDHIYKY